MPSARAVSILLASAYLLLPCSYCGQDTTPGKGREWSTLFASNLRDGNTDAACVTFHRFLVSTNGTWGYKGNGRTLQEITFSLTDTQWNKGIDNLSKNDISILDLRYRIATQLLRIGDSLPPDVLYRAVSTLLLQSEYQKYILAEKGRTSIREYLRSLIYAYILMSGEIDPSLDEKGVIYLNMTVPGQPKYPSGISPGDVKEPKARAAYIKELERNRKYAESLGRKLAWRKATESLGSDLDALIDGFREDANGRLEVGRLAASLVIIPGFSKEILENHEQAKEGTGP